VLTLVCMKRQHDFFWRPGELMPSTLHGCPFEDGSTSQFPEVISCGKLNG